MNISQPVNNPSPKQRFIESTDNVSKHREMVDTREFQRAMDFGMMQFCGALAAEVNDGASAKAVGLKLRGAFDFMHTVRMLSERPQVPKITPLSSSLNETK